jgi:hypothetical protein
MVQSAHFNVMEKSFVILGWGSSDMKCCIYRTCRQLDAENWITVLHLFMPSCCKLENATSKNFCRIFITWLKFPEHVLHLINYWGAHLRLKVIESTDSSKPFTSPRLMITRSNDLICTTRMTNPNWSQNEVTVAADLIFGWKPDNLTSERKELPIGCKLQGNIIYKRENFGYL